MNLVPVLIGLASLVPPVSAMADQDESAPAIAALADLTAHQAVREGNRLLIEGNPPTALDAYRHAEQLEPDAREIAFVKGLAHYDLKEFEQARQHFEKATALASDSLADDSLYSSGACDHTQALESVDDPQLALSLLESAMRRYHDVLAKQPDHRFARDANLKAATMWRELKQQLQQQQQQQQDSDQKQDNRDRENEDQQQQQNENREPESRQDQPQDQAERQQQQQRQQLEQQQQQESKVDQQERVSREQAERKLREMMQAIRERKKTRRKPVQRIPVTPVDKDW